VINKLGIHIRNIENKTNISKRCSRRNGHWRHQNSEVRKISGSFCVMFVIRSLGIFRDQACINYYPFQCV